MIYTSYYARFAKLPKAKDVVGVQVSNSYPKWLDVSLVNMKELAPNWGLVERWKAGSITEEEFKRVYLQELECKVNKSEVVAKLLDLLNEHDDVVLLCYEKVGDVCHRHWLAEWLDIGIKEMPY